ncbi:complement factor I [Hyperolius riggenbachi]|uniref:complement factor I n=1 Tax=Hyperolius riggenbachi TaxID=752182 RepID=UPI0035A2A8F8
MRTSRTVWLLVSLACVCTKTAEASSPPEPADRGPQASEPQASSHSLQSAESQSKAKKEDKRKQDACWEKKYTSFSCQKVFCEPWQRCVEGKCVCKMPYQCPKNTTFNACSETKKPLNSYCLAKSAECNFGKPEYKFASDSPCKGKIKLSVKNENETKVNKKGFVEIQLPGQLNKFIVCPERWTVQEANVVCRQLGNPKGAFTDFLQYNATENYEQTECLHVTCRGMESSLAECTLRKGTLSGHNLGAVYCYEDKNEGCTSHEFTCVNGKCIPENNICNGADDCGDLSDELCCSDCTNGFHCKSDVCISPHQHCNGERDCIAGDDEVHCKECQNSFRCNSGECIPLHSVCNGGHDCPSGEDEVNCKDQAKTQNQDNDQDHVEEQGNENAVTYDIESERTYIKKFLPTVSCGVPLKKAETKRVKRIIGGEKATKNQFPWQVAIKEGSKVNCGGIYIGGCWVLTAAHCVRPDQPNKYHVIVELLDRLSTTEIVDTFPVKSVKVHDLYNSATYENDIALLEVVNIYNEPACMQVENDLVPACIPWSPHLFKAGEKCVVSGWGREEGFTKVFHLKWGFISLMDNCSAVYNQRFFPDKMECAGTYDGSIDACKGDSGGPLVCFDANNVVYIWGIVSWGENCGVAGYPGVYTKVANYYEWIGRQVGRQLISKYNV